MKINKKKIVFLSSIFLVVATGLFIYRDYIAKAATYGWEQLGWGGGIIATQEACEALGGTWLNSACVANHTNNQDGWTAYSAVDSNVSAGDSLSITSEVTSLEHTSSDDFSSGDSVGTLTTGDQVSLDLP